MSKAGEINGWKCDGLANAAPTLGADKVWKMPEPKEPFCGRITYVIHVDDGVTPMFLGCRADGVDPSQPEPPAHCKGTATSMMYPAPPVPQEIIDAVAWEWHAASKSQLKRMRRDEPAMYDYCIQGGLMLRPLTDAGRAKLAEVEVA